MTQHSKANFLTGLVLGVALLAASPAFGAKMAPKHLIALAGRDPQSAEFRQALTETTGADVLQKGTAVLSEGPDFLWAIESAGQPSLFVDDQPRPAMTRVAGTNLWFETGRLAAGRAHSFHYVIGGNKFGGNLSVPAYAPDSYEQPGVPQGKLSEKLLHVSKIYDGMESDYWIYVPAQYDPKTPAALMVWQDGQGHISRTGVSRTLNVVDNLMHQKKIPVMIQVFTSPGDISKAAGTPTFEFVSAFSSRTKRTLKDSMRSTEYDTVSDRYATFLRDELLAEVQAKYNIRKDAYSRGISGSSSGAIAAFNAAWQQPDQFSRVLSHIGTYTSIQWQPGVLDGGNIYPFRIRKEPRRNIRVWLQDGAEDLENEHGSWPLQNIQMANSLKMKGYDFHLSFGNGPHSGAQGSAEAPESLTWLWRDYDPARTEQIYEMQPEEKAKPLFRVKIYNRE